MPLLDTFRLRQSGSPPALQNADLDGSLLQRLYHRLVEALARGDREALGLLLGDETEFHSGDARRRGRDTVRAALQERLGGAALACGPVSVRVIDERAVLEAEWCYDCPLRGPFAAQVRAVFARRRGYWQLLQLREAPDMPA